jgi:hypothetical protein
MVLRRRVALALALSAFLLTAGSSWAGPAPTVDVQPQGTSSGSVTGVPFAGSAVINCVWNGTARSGDCDETFAAATQIAVTASAAAGAQFGGWMGTAGCPGTTSGAGGVTCTFTADPSTPVVLQPAFDPDVTATLIVGPQGAGTGAVTGVVPGAVPDIGCLWNGSATTGVCDAAITAFPTTVDLAAAATGASTFPGWTTTTCPGGTISMDQTTCSITLDDPSDSVTVQPSFQGADTVATLTVAPQGTGTGSVVGTGPSGSVINCTWNGTTATGDCTEDVGTGQGGEFTLVATPDPGSSVTWTNCPGTVSSNGSTCTLTIDSPNDDNTVVPAFTQTPGPPGCTVVGTEGDDNLMGTAGDDVICGLGGDDVILALDGNDRVLGGTGDDRMVGGGGADELNGGSGDDRAIGGSGGDELNGQAGDDRLDGQDGSDRANGGSGIDRIYGGGASDSLSGGAGFDRLFGGAGADSVNGGSGPDSLYGGTGADRLIGGPGFDRAFGQGGSDFCTAEQESSC